LIAHFFAYFAFIAYESTVQYYGAILT